MIKTLIYRNEKACEKILNGVNKMADAVASTLGPFGENVGIDRFIPSTGENYDNTILHDGVSVARAIVLPDRAENFVAQILAEASKKQVDMCGDGTTATMVLAQAIIQECLKLIAAGIHPMSLRRGLEQGRDILVTELEKLALPVKTQKELEFVATISANDQKLGKMIASAFKVVGVDGVVTAEISKSPHTTMEVQEGMQLDQGLLSPYLVTNRERLEATLENAYFLVTDKPITYLGDFANFFTEFVKQSQNLVIISPDISGEALPLLIQNKLAGKINLILIKAPSMGQDQKDILQDIAALTDGKFISEDAAHKFEDLQVEDLGFAESITATQKESIIVGGRGTKKQIDARIASIKKQLEDVEGDFDKERLQSRLGKLTNGIAIIRVGGQTEVEMKERRERVLDSIGATRAAMEKGIVAGGEIAYLHIRKILGKSLTDKILYESLYKPFLKLITNADLSEVDMALKLHGKSRDHGVDVMSGEVKNLVVAGIVDPVLVPINAIKNAISVSIQLITTATLIVPEEKEYTLPERRK